jgi:hypothetical protein
MRLWAGRVRGNNSRREIALLRSAPGDGAPGCKNPQDDYALSVLSLSYKEGAPWAKFVCDRYARGLATYLSSLITTSGGLATFVIRGGLGQNLVLLIESEVFSYMSVMNALWLKNYVIHITPSEDNESNADAFLGGAKLFLRDMK